MRWTALTGEPRDCFDANGYLLVPNAVAQPTRDRLSEAGNRLAMTRTCAYGAQLQKEHL